MNTGTEKRKYPRAYIKLPVRYRKLREGAGVQGTGSVSSDLSQGGIRFTTAEFIAMACRMIVELEIPALSKPVKAISKVAWIRRTDSPDRYEVGNQFVEMSKEDKSAVENYLGNLPSTGSGIAVH